MPRIFFHTNGDVISPHLNPIMMISHPVMNHGYQDFLSSHKNDKFCWNDSLTFNGRSYAVNPDICMEGGECISQYRIRDGSFDCYQGEDEELLLKENYCTGNVGRHRFQYFNDEHKCLTLKDLGSGTVECSNNYDESWYATGTDLRRQFQCLKAITTGCHIVKAYIQQSSTRNSRSLILNNQNQRMI